MNRQELIDFCLTFPSSFEDYPFDVVADGTATAVMRLRSNKKSFALILRHNGKLYLNLKCDSFEADILRQTFKGVIPGWHMNRKHWNTVIVDDDVPEELIKRMIENSYDLVKTKE